MLSETPGIQNSQSPVNTVKFWGAPLGSPCFLLISLEYFLIY